MQRTAFLMRILPGRKAEFIAKAGNPSDDLKKAVCESGISNFSIWSVSDYAFGYMEIADGAATPDSAKAIFADAEQAVSGLAEFIARPGEMRLMYEDLGVVHPDKSEIRHRVFATLIHPGCADEYKLRHDRLSEGRKGRPVMDHSDSNFTIWCADGRYNFGYCEKVKAFDHEMTEREKESTIAWETKMVEIMDWLTDDVDWITGETHDKMECVVQF